MTLLNECLSVSIHGRTAFESPFSKSGFIPGAPAKKILNGVQRIEPSKVYWDLITALCQLCKKIFFGFEKFFGTYCICHKMGRPLGTIAPVLASKKSVASAAALQGGYHGWRKVTVWGKGSGGLVGVVQKAITV
jgi:hypothetical protein